MTLDALIVRKPSRSIKAQIPEDLQGDILRRVSHLDSLKPKILVAILVKGIIGFI